MSRYSTSKGKAGEHVARLTLQAMGFADVRRIPNAWKITGWKNRRRNLAFVVPEHKVAGDIRAVVPGTGRSVLCEVKRRNADGRLQFSMLPEHQRESLTKHADAGGISLLCWIDDHSDTVFLFQWPIDGFIPGTSIDYEQARAIHVNSIGEIQ